MRPCPILIGSHHPSRFTSRSILPVFVAFSSPTLSISPALIVSHIRLLAFNLISLIPIQVFFYPLVLSSYLFSFLSPGLHLLRLYSSSLHPTAGALLALTNFRLITVITSINERGLSS
ncbi:hypothetical protein ILYODFUR_037768 [Ilyodon furcidens]|uniref:Uncharacterized protein n=1 Tax=Ilyodon furcidens TaxID=33524 RepID=A0ABV0U1G9_9TELE